jgi:ATP-dependent exoDNAse (exonuclease V) beta subunit
MASNLLVDQREPDTMEIVMSDEVTLKVLIEIREELRGTREEIRGTNQRVDQLTLRVDQLAIDTTHKFDQLRTELKGELLESEVRQSTRMTELIASTRNLHDLLADRFDLRDRVERCESEIAELKKRVSY